MTVERAYNARRTTRFAFLLTVGIAEWMYWFVRFVASHGFVPRLVSRLYFQALLQHAPRGSFEKTSRQGRQGTPRSRHRQTTFSLFRWITRDAVEKPWSVPFFSPFPASSPCRRATSALLASLAVKSWGSNHATHSGQLNKPDWTKDELCPDCNSSRSNIEEPPFS